MKNKIVLAFIFTCGLLMATVSVEAQGGPKNGNYGEGRNKAEGFLAELNLTNEQREKIRELKQSSPSRWQSKREVFEQQKKLHQMLKDPATQEADILAQAEIINKQTAEANFERVSQLLELRKVLTAEQFSGLLDKMQAKKEEFRQGVKQGMKEGFKSGNRGGMRQ